MRRLWLRPPIGVQETLGIFTHTRAGFGDASAGVTQELVSNSKKLINSPGYSWNGIISLVCCWCAVRGELRFLHVSPGKVVKYHENLMYSIGDETVCSFLRMTLH